MSIRYRQVRNRKLPRLEQDMPTTPQGDILYRAAAVVAALMVLAMAVIF